MTTTKISLSRQSDLSAGGSVISNVGTPVAGSDAANKAYVDAAAVGIDWKASVRAATTVAGTLASSFENGDTIDGVVLATGDRILIKDQASGAENGIYTVNPTGAPTRATDADTSAEVTSGLAVFVEEGTTNDNTGWRLNTNGTIILGTTALVFGQFTGTGDITVDTTLTKTGNQLSRSAITGDVSIPSGSNTSTIGTNVVTLGMLAQLPSNTVIANLTGSTATPTAVAASAQPTTSNIVARDSNGNTKTNNFVDSLSTTVTAAGTTTLAASSSKSQEFTGTTTQTVTLPNATTLSAGHQFFIFNRSTGIVTVNANGGGLIQTMAPGSQALVSAVTVATSAGTWDVDYTITKLPSGTVMGNLSGSTADIAAVTAISTLSSSTVVARDSNGVFAARNVVSDVSTTVTAAGTTTLVTTSSRNQQFTGTTTQTVVMPSATSLYTGEQYTILNRSTGVVTVNANGGGLLLAVPGGSQATFTVVDKSTSAGVWDVTAEGQGTVTSVSVVSANGLAGSVATATTTPAITLSTTVTGVLKGNGTAISAAVAGTDYMAPSSFVDRETPSGSVNGSNTAFVLANTPLTGSEHVYLNGLLQDSGGGNDYTISGTTITFASAPVSPDKIRVSYRK